MLISNSDINKMMFKNTRKYSHSEEKLLNITFCLFHNINLPKKASLVTIIPFVLWGVCEIRFSLLQSFITSKTNKERRGFYYLCHPKLFNVMFYDSKNNQTREEHSIQIVFMFFIYKVTKKNPTTNVDWYCYTFVS